MMDAMEAATTLEWHPQSTSAPALGVALVLHGLNVHPPRMLPLVRELNRCGYAALTCALAGHGVNYLPAAGLDEDEARLRTLGRATYRLWCDEATAAYHIAAGYATPRGVPLVLVGFSLGAVIGCAAALTSPHVNFDKMVLFAPALRIRLHSKVLKLLSPWPQLVIPSASPAAYRANRGTTIAAYSALYDAQADCERALGSQLVVQLDVPTLVFVDPQDELVSTTGLRNLAVERGLLHWQFFVLHKSDGARTHYHHLMIDPESVGPAMWSQMMARMRLHLSKG